MTWISLVCLLALSSSAFGRSAYGTGYGAASIPQMSNILTSIRDQTLQRPTITLQGYGQQPSESSSSFLPQQDVSIPKIQTGYGAQIMTPSIPRTLPVQGYGQVSQGYGAAPRLPQLDQQVAPVPELTPADLLCRGQRPETVIPIENNRKFVVCLDESKGVEQQCPKGLFYHEQSRRCERKLGQLENVCATQPCLNGGQCVPTDSWYQCQCAPGFDGKNCELDARVCQVQYPCGQSPDVRCQSFRLGAALQYVCIIQDGAAYGLNAQQIIPSPCQGVDGPHALAVSNGGFIMCDGERMFVESCPGGTIWDDANKACVWPDMQVGPQQDQGYGQSSYGQSRTINTPKAISSYGQAPQFDHPRPHHAHQHHHHKHMPRIEVPRLGYGAQVPQPALEQPKSVQGYGAPQPAFEQPKPVQGYGAPQPAFEQPKSVQGYGAPQPAFEQPKPVQGYGAPQPAFEQPKQVQGYGAPQPAFEQPKSVQGYGAQINLPRPSLEQPKQVQGYGAPQPAFEQPKQIQGYGAPQPAFEQPKPVQGYGAQINLPRPSFEQPRPVQGYGAPQQDLTPKSSSY